MATELPDDWWMASDCAKYCGHTSRTWWSLVARGQAPRWERTFGRTRAWRPEVVMAWAARRPRKPRKIGE